MPTTESTPFRNPPLNLDALPRLASLPLRPVAPTYARYRLLRSLLLWLPLLLVIATLPQRGVLPPWLGVAATAAVMTLGPITSLLAWLEARRRAYAAREHDLIYRSGLLVTRLRALPIARIQHVETLSGPLERLLGLERLRCFTAGGSSGDLLLAGLDADTAGRLREYLLARIPEPDVPPQRSTDD